MKHAAIILLVSGLILLSGGCSNSVQSVSDITSLQLRDFLWSQTPDMMLNFLQTSVATDSNLVEVERSVDTLSLKILSQRLSTAGGLTYVRYERPGGDAATLVADGQNFWYSDDSLVNVYQVFLHAPIRLHDTFASKKHGDSIDVETVAVNSPLVLNNQQYNTIVTVRTHVSVDKSTTTTERDSIWLSPNFGLVRESIHRQTSTGGPHPLSDYRSVELFSITHP